MVHQEQKRAYKINICFGLVFERMPFEKTDDYTYSLALAFDNRFVLEEPLLISNDNDFKKFLSICKLNNQYDFMSNFESDNPDTKTKIIGVFQMMIKIFHTNNPIGSNIVLPDILNNPKLVYTAFNTMTKEDDNMCFWRCLAKHLNKKVVNKRLVKIAKDLFKQYYQKSSKDYEGVNVTEFNDIEKFFNVQIRYYDLKVIHNENKPYIEATKMRSANTKDVLTLGMYETHFIYIHDIHKLCKSYKCDSCGQIFTRHDSMVDHQRNTCGSLHRDEFTDKIKEFTHKVNTMKEILTYCGKDGDISFQYPYFGVYDFESCANNIDERKGTNTIILNKQVPISFSMFSNLPDQEVIHEVNNKANDLIKSLVENMMKMYATSNKLVFYEYYKFIHHFCVNKLKMKYYNTKEPVEATPDNIVFNIAGTYYVLESKLNEGNFKNKNTFKIIKQRNESYIKKIKKWLEFPMIGYNNSFYDINICKDYGFIDSFQALSSLKMGQRYKTLSNGKICILDQIQYC